MGLFSKPDIPVVETPTEEDTQEELALQRKREKESLGAFFGGLRRGGAAELKGPNKTGLNL